MFTAVTVAFGREKPLLRLQARSLDQFVNWVDEIILIDNEPSGCNLHDAVAYYGQWAHKVRILPAHEIIGAAGPNPYYDQMAAKIQVHKFCKNEHVMILDAKNWFIKSVPPERILSKGKYLTESYALTEPWDQTWRNSLRLFSLSEEEFASMPVSCRTPFFLNRATLEGLDGSVDVKHLISSMRRFSEFCLINAFIISEHGSLDEYFLLNKSGYCSGVWPGYGNDEKIVERLVGREFRNQNIFCTGMHRNVWATIDSDRRTAIIADWVDLGLLNESEGNRLFDDMIRLNPLIDRLTI